MPYAGPAAHDAAAGAQGAGRRSGSTHGRGAAGESVRSVRLSSPVRVYHLAEQIQLILSARCGPGGVSGAGTTRIEHAIDNNGASRGRMPDAAMRVRIEATYDDITAQASL